MKRTLRSAVPCLFALALALSLVPTVSLGQSRDARVIAVHAGGVNFVVGDVKYQPIGESGWQKVTSKVDLKSGDLLKSGGDGRVEVLLNPGSYLRLGGSSELELEDTSLDTLRLKLYSGSAVIEATGYDGASLSIAVDTPQTTTKIVRRGIYRFNVTAGNVTEVFVVKGRVLVGNEPAFIVKDGKVARVGPSGTEIAKFDKDKRDALDLWSRDRAKELARLNRKLEMEQTRSMIANTDFSRFYGRFNTLGAFGVWVYSSAFGCYTFLPFYDYWNSPYGGRYGSYWAYSPLCGACGSRRYRSVPSWNGNNDTWQPNSSPSDVSSPGPKVSPPPVSSPPPDPTPRNPVPVTRGSDGEIFAPRMKDKPQTRRR